MFSNLKTPSFSAPPHADGKLDEVLESTKHFLSILLEKKVQYVRIGHLFKSFSKQIGSMECYVKNETKNGSI